MENILLNEKNNFYQNINIIRSNNLVNHNKIENMISDLQEYPY